MMSLSKLRWIGGGVNRWYDEGLPLPKNHHCINIIVDCHLYCSTNPNSNTRSSKMKLQIAALFALVTAADAGVSYPTVAVSIYFYELANDAILNMFHEFSFHVIVICA